MQIGVELEEDGTTGLTTFIRMGFLATLQKYKYHSRLNRWDVRCRMPGVCFQYHFLAWLVSRLAWFIS